MDPDKSEEKTNSSISKAQKTKLTRRSSRVKCEACRKRLGLANRYGCRCKKLFCSSHRYPETHQCTHDYRAEGRRLIALNNPVTKGSKLPKI